MIEIEMHNKESYHVRLGLERKRNLKMHRISQRRCRRDRPRPGSTKSHCRKGVGREAMR